MLAVLTGSKAITVKLQAPRLLAVASLWLPAATTHAGLTVVQHAVRIRACGFRSHEGSRSGLNRWDDDLLVALTLKLRPPRIWPLSHRQA